jgi:two-component system, cell cycle sensor histidine kinase and response regulator CckA
MADPGNPKKLVLVVDDEPEIRLNATLALSDAGYLAEVAEDGKGGLASFIQHQSEICLVLADAVMPVMDGIQMVEKIRELNPEMKIVFMTGYSEAELKVLTQTNFPVLRKPFLPADLTWMITDLLASGKAAGTTHA